MDALVPATPIESTLRDNGAGDMAAAYVAGYADGLTLLHSDGHDQPAVEPLERIYARYLRYVELDPATPEARVYVAGFRDAAADNLPCPPHEIESHAPHLAASSLEVLGRTAEPGEANYQIRDRMRGTKMRIFRALIPVALMLGMLALPAPSSAQVAIGVSVGIAPPELPIYEQPPIPGYGYVWTPGYWAYGPEGYYWVPGTWVLPPTIGYLWTPPWWGWGDGGYLWHAGYWGPHVGFYGGINYGFGYFGSGYEGGYWDHGRLYYNREVNNFGGRRLANVYDRPPTRRGFENRVAFNGGTGGVTAQETAQERAAAGERHLQPTSLQTQHVRAAGAEPSFRHSVNNGTPAITATSRPGRFNTTGNAAALGATNGPKVQSNTRSIGRAPALGATGGPRVQNNTRTTTTGTGTPNTFGQRGSKNLGQGTPKNFGQSTPRTVGQGAPRNFVQRAPTVIHPAVQGGAHPAVQGGAPHITNQRAVTPHAQPVVKAGQGQGQPKGKNDRPGG
jgi:hypothetical protein